MYTVASFFTGCSGSDLGFESERFDIVFSNEINTSACDTYEANFGRRPFDVPIEYLPLAAIPEANIFIGGPPCQSFSNARSGGYSKGYQSMDGLKYIRRYAEIVEAKQPELFIMENAPTLIKQPSKMDVLREIINLFKSYKVRPYLLNAEDYGVPQQRERTFLLGTRSDVDLVFPFIRPDTDHWRFHCSGWAEWLGLPNEGWLVSRGSRLKGKSPFECAYTVIGTEVPVIRYEQPTKIKGSLFSGERVTLNQRYLTVEELARLQGFPSDYIFCGSKNEQLLQIGNAWCVPVAQALARQAKKTLNKWREIC